MIGDGAAIIELTHVCREDHMGVRMLSSDLLDAHAQVEHDQVCRARRHDSHGGQNRGRGRGRGGRGREVRAWTRTVQLAGRVRVRLRRAADNSSPVIRCPVSPI